MYEARNIFCRRGFLQNMPPSLSQPNIWDEKFAEYLRWGLNRSGYINIGSKYKWEICLCQHDDTPTGMILRRSAGNRYLSENDKDGILSVLCRLTHPTFALKICCLLETTDDELFIAEWLRKWVWAVEEAGAWELDAEEQCLSNEELDELNTTCSRVALGQGCSGSGDVDLSGRCRAQIPLRSFFIYRRPNPRFLYEDTITPEESQEDEDFWTQPPEPPNPPKETGFWSDWYFMES
jgi:hypothetical protein